MGLRPVGKRPRVPAEHGLARAGRVHQHGVAPGSQQRAERVRAHAGHKGVLYAQPLQRTAEHAGAGGADFVGDEQAPVLHGRGKLARLAAGGGAEVEHGLSGLRAEQRGRKLRRGLLHIEQARSVQRLCAGRKALRDKKALRDYAAGLLRKAEQGKQGRGVGFERVDPQRAPRRPRHGGKIRLKFGFSQLRAHAGEEGFGQVHGAGFFF